METERDSEVTYSKKLSRLISKIYNKHMSDGVKEDRKLKFGYRKDKLLHHKHEYGDSNPPSLQCENTDEESNSKMFRKENQISKNDNEDEDHVSEDTSCSQVNTLKVLSQTIVSNFEDKCLGIKRKSTDSDRYIETENSSENVSNKRQKKTITSYDETSDVSCHQCQDSSISLQSNTVTKLAGSDIDVDKECIRLASLCELQLSDSEISNDNSQPLGDNFSEAEVSNNENINISLNEDISISNNPGSISYDKKDNSNNSSETIKLKILLENNDDVEEEEDSSLASLRFQKASSKRNSQSQISTENETSRKVKKKAKTLQDTNTDKYNVSLVSENNEPDKEGEEHDDELICISNLHGKESKMFVSTEVKDEMRNLMNAEKPPTAAQLKVFNVNTLTFMLKYNGRPAYNLPKNELVKMIAEYMRDGCPPRCPKCKRGALKFSNGKKTTGKRYYWCPGSTPNGVHIYGCNFKAKKGELENNQWKCP